MAAICNICGLPDELCICQEIAKEQQRAILSTDRRRYGKIVTKVEGIEDSAIDINNKLAKILKNQMRSRWYSERTNNRTSRRPQEKSGWRTQERRIQCRGAMI